MTSRISEVAVCCSRDSRSSVSSRAFSMAMTAWAAKLVTSAICLSANGRVYWRARAIAPISSFSFSIGTAKKVRIPAISTPSTVTGSRSI